MGAEISAQLFKVPPLVLSPGSHRLLRAHVVQGLTRDLKGIYMQIRGLLLSEFSPIGFQLL